MVRLRQLHAGRSLDVAAVAAVVAGLAAIATSAVAGPAMWHEDRARFAALIELAAASVWFVETAYALGRVAERLAASPVALAKSYQRHRAAWVAGTFTILPLLFGAAAGAAAFLQPAAGASFGAAVVVWFAYNHVELARLLAASCDLPEASAVERHT